MLRISHGKHDGVITREIPTPLAHGFKTYVVQTSLSGPLVPGSIGLEEEKGDRRLQACPASKHTIRNSFFLPSVYPDTQEDALAQKKPQKTGVESLRSQGTVCIPVKIAAFC